MKINGTLTHKSNPIPADRPPGWKSDFKDGQLFPKSK